MCLQFFFVALMFTTSLANTILLFSDRGSDEDSYFQAYHRYLMGFSRKGKTWYAGCPGHDGARKSDPGYNRVFFAANFV